MGRGHDHIHQGYRTLSSPTQGNSDWCKKKLLAKKLANNKNPQFLSNQAEFQAILPTHELVILTKFYNNWIKIVDFIINLLFGQ